jgi:hypothetical protein
MAYNRWPSSSGSYAPITYVRGFPVDLTTLITALHVLTTVICAVALAMNLGPLWESRLLFDTRTFWQGRIWTVLTDAFYHNISNEHILLAVSLYLFYHFGTEIERLIGRLHFGLLYVLLLVVPAAASLLASFVFGTTMGVRIPFVGIPAHFAIFIGFTYIYPGALFFFGITARMISIIFISVTILALIAKAAWPAFFPFAAALGTVYFYLSFVGAGRSLGFLDVWQSWSQQKQDQKIQKRLARKKVVKQEQEASVDAILDKINLHGLHSLTAKERAFLEKKGTQLRAGERKDR